MLGAKKRGSGIGRREKIALRSIVISRGSGLCVVVVVICVLVYFCC